MMRLSCFDEILASIENRCVISFKTNICIYKGSYFNTACKLVYLNFTDSLCRSVDINIFLLNIKI